MQEITKVGAEIVDKLAVNGYDKIVKHIRETVGSTGGEIVSQQAWYLVHLKSENPEAYQLIEIDLMHYLILLTKYGTYINDSPVKHGKAEPQLITIQTFSDFSMVESAIKLLRKNNIEISLEDISPRNKIVATWDLIQKEFNLNVKKEDSVKALALLNSLR